jgi:hypothetical protein
MHLVLWICICCLIIIFGFYFFYKSLRKPAFRSSNVGMSNGIAREYIAKIRENPLMTAALMEELKSAADTYCSKEHFDKCDLWPAAVICRLYAASLLLGRSSTELSVLYTATKWLKKSASIYSKSKDNMNLRSAITFFNGVICNPNPSNAVDLSQFLHHSFRIALIEASETEVIEYRDRVLKLITNKS